MRDAEAMFERLLAIRNDLGLLAEEFDPMHGRLLGNFPQGFSHLTLIHTATVLAAEPEVRVGREDGARAAAAAQLP
jgi:GH15 family glucan-1,4-alpha-glucosidase